MINMVKMGHLQILFIVILFVDGIKSQLQDSKFPESTPSPPKQPEPQNFTVVLLRANAITLRWDQPSDWIGEGIGYAISENGQSVQLQGINNCQFRRTSLTPSTNYNFSLVAVSQELPGVQITSDPVTLAVLTNSFDEPSQPRNFRIVYQDGDQALLGWDPPKQWNAQDGGYVITTTEEDGTSSSVRLKKNAKRFNPTGIQTGALYTYEVLAYNQKDGDEKSSAPLRLQLRRRPDKPSNLKIETITETTIEVSWKKPEGEEVDGYNVYHVANNIGTDIIKPDVTSYVIEGLTPWTNCFISVSSYKDVKVSRVSSENITAVVKTDFAAPGEPEWLAIVREKAREVTLEWKAPPLPNGPLSGYILSWMHDGKPYEKTTKTTKLTIKDLKPWTEYKFSVAAYNSMNGRTVQGRSKSDTAETLVAAPGAIDPPTIPVIGSTVFIVKWEKPTEPNGPVDGYLVTLQQIDGPQIRNVTTKDLRYTFNNLFPWSEYNLTVVPFNLLHREPLYGPASYNLTMTEVGGPTVVINLKSTEVTNTSIGVSWEPPKTFNGPMDGYEITVFNEHFISKTSITTETNWTARGLTPWTDNRFQVNAFNYNSKGEKVYGPTASLVVTSGASAPPEPTQNLTVTQTGNDEAFLEIPVDLFSGEYGFIEEHMLLVTFNKSEDMLPKRGFEKANETDFPSWAEAKNRGIWYRTSPEKWNFLIDKTICSLGDKSSRKCVIGQQKSCDKVKLCDGPLASKTEYWAKIRGYTTNGWAETFAVHFTTGKSIKATSGIAVFLMIALLKIIM